MAASAAHHDVGAAAALPTTGARAARERPARGRDGGGGRARECAYRLRRWQPRDASLAPAASLADRVRLPSLTGNVVHLIDRHVGYCALPLGLLNASDHSDRGGGIQNF